MKSWLGLGVAAVLASLAVGSAAAPANPKAPAATGQPGWRGALSEGPCTAVPRLEELSADKRARLRCGRLSVPLDHAEPNGRTIELGIAVRAAAGPAAPEAVVILNGGTVGSLRSAGPSFGPPYPQNRDVLLIDPRGTDSSGFGICKDTTRAKIAAMAADIEGEALARAYNAPLATCRAEMRAAGIPPHVFGAVAMARDLELLRAALGYERLILIGQSQGTTIAPTYAALFPGRTAAMVLDSAYPPDPTPKTLSASFREGLSGAAAWCKGQAICGPARDRLLDAYDAAHRELRRAPMRLTTATFGPFVLNADDLDLVVQHLLYPGVRRAVQPDVTPFAIGPAMIAAVEARDVELASKIADQSLRRLASGPDSAVFASGECRDRPRYRQPPATPFTGVELIDFARVCGQWTDAPVDPVRLPPAGSVPALVLSGTTDPITPVSFGEDMARRLGNSARLLRLSGWGHGTANPAPCARTATLAFLENPRLDAIPERCPD